MRPSLCVCPSAWTRSAATGSIFMKFNIWEFFSKIWQENSIFIKAWQEWRVLYMKMYTFMIISCWILLGIGKVSDKRRKNQKDTFYVQYHFTENRLILRVNVKKYGRARQATDDNTIRCILFAWWMTKTTNTHSLFFTATVVTRKCHNVKFKRTLLVLFILQLVSLHYSNLSVWRRQGSARHFSNLPCRGHRLKSIAIGTSFSPY